MKKLLNWKYTIIFLFLFGSIKPIPINDDGSYKDTTNKSGLDNIPESYQSQKKIEFSKKENDSTKGVYMEDVKKNNVNETEIESNKIIPKIPTTNLSYDNDLSEDNPSSIIVDDKNANNNSINKGLNNLKHSNNKDNINKNSYNEGIINTDTVENINVDSDKSFNQSFDNISEEGLNNSSNSLNTEKNLIMEDLIIQIQI